MRAREFNEKNDWVLQQIKRARVNSVDDANYKVMPGGLEAAMNRFDELAKSYVEHLKNKNIK